MQPLTILGILVSGEMDRKDTGHLHLNNNLEQQNDDDEGEEEETMMMQEGY